MHGRFIYWMERETCPVYSLSLFFSPSSHPFVFASLSFPAFLPFTDRKPAHSSLSFYVSPSVNLSIHSSFLVFLSMLLPTRDLRITFSLYQFLPLSVCLHGCLSLHLFLSVSAYVPLNHLQHLLRFLFPFVPPPYNNLSTFLSPFFCSFLTPRPLSFYPSPSFCPPLSFSLPREHDLHGYGLD